MVIQSIKNIDYTNKKSNPSSHNKNVPANQVSHSLSNLPKPIAFLGFKDIFSILRQTKSVAGKTFKGVISTEREAINALKKQESGLYVGNNQGFSYLPFSELEKIEFSSAPILIYKHPKQNATGEKSLEHRPGITLRLILKALEKGIEKVIAIADEEIQVLTLPKDRKLADKAIIGIKQKAPIPNELKKPSNTPDKNLSHDYIFERAQTIVNALKIDGLNLEQAGY